MRWTWVLGLVIAGCSGLFEDNPQFVETETTAAASSGTAAATSTGMMPAAETTAGMVSCEPDGFEPNAGEDALAMLPDFSAMSGGMVVDARLEGLGAEDWYTYTGQDDGVGNRVAKVFLEGQLALQACVYLQCADGQSITVGCGANDDVVSPQGLPGCCGDTDVSTTHECGGVEGGSVVAIVQVTDGLDREECLPYSLDYRF